MSARIYRLLAEDLDISEERAQKLLRAMMREVQKRAQRGGGIRIPQLGAFVVEDGEMQFTPSDSLASAVNHRYEGLSEEDLSTAGEDPEDEEEDADKGPTTITSGFQSALSSGTGSTETGSAGSASDADTDEFQMSDAESDVSADTEEFQRPSESPPSADEESSRSTASEESPEEPDDAAESSSPDTGSLYDIVEQTPGAGPVDSDPSPSSAGDADTPKEEPSPTAEETDEKTDEESAGSSKSSIWDTDEPWDFSQASMSEEGDEEETSSEPSPSPSGDREASDRPPEADPSPAASSSEDAETADSESDTDQPPASPASQEASSQTSQPAPASDGRGGSTVARILVSLIVGILIAGAAWFMAGQQGLVPPPGKVLASLQSPASSSPAASTSPSASETATSPQGDAATSTGDTGQPSAETSPTDASASDASTGAASEGDAAASESSATAGFTSGGGNWTISVASRADRSVAEDLANSYRNRFSATDLPVDIVTGTVDGQERHRVGVGQFSDRDEARAAIEQYGDSLPPGAWPVQINP